MGSGSELRDREAHQPTQLQPFCFSLSVQRSISHRRYSPFYYKIGFVDAAQLEVSVSVASMFKKGLAKLCCRLGILNAFFAFGLLGLLGQSPL